MSNDPFVILGITKDATQSEILAAYNEKKEYYQAHIYDEGESGAEAARMIGVISDAYQRAMEYNENQAKVSGYGESKYEEVKKLLKEHRATEAQKFLDDITYRDAEWHYFQSIIFYEQSWYLDSKRQLEMCVEMDPTNPKYSKALENVKKKIDGTKPFTTDDGSKENERQYATQRTYAQQEQDARDTSDACCTACQTLWCLDCCCECMGGDLIRCC